MISNHKLNKQSNSIQYISSFYLILLEKSSLLLFSYLLFLQSTLHKSNQIFKIIITSIYPPLHVNMLLINTMWNRKSAVFNESEERIQDHYIYE